MRGIVCALSGAVAILAGPASGSGTGDGEARATAAVEAEAILLIELGALRQPVPPVLSDLHRQWSEQATPLDRASLLERLWAADQIGLEARQALSRDGRSLSRPVGDVLGPLSPRDMATIRSGGLIRLPAFVYQDALVDLRRRGGALPAHRFPGPPPHHEPPPRTEHADTAWLPDAPRGSAPAPTAPRPIEPEGRPSPSAATPKPLPDSPGAEVTSSPSATSLAWLALTLSAFTAIAVVARPVLRSRNRADPDAELGELVAVGRRMTQALELSEVETIAVDEALQITDARHGAFLLVGSSSIDPTYESRPGLLHPDGLASSVIRRVAETGQAIRRVARDDPALGGRPAALIAAPVMGEGRVQGILMVVREATRPFTRSAAQAVDQLAPMLGTARDVARRHGHVAELAATDELTGTMNRRRLDADLDETLSRARGQTGFVMVDVDHFKAFNDAFGHGAGDEALRIVAAAIKRAVREEDTVYRYGGEEFSILLPNATSAEARAVAERVRVAVEEASRSMGDGFGRVTVSAGCASSGGGPARQLVEAADAALYRAKRTGRNRVRVAAG